MCLYVRKGLWAAPISIKPPKGGYAEILPNDAICQWGFLKELKENQRNGAPLTYVHEILEFTCTRPKSKDCQKSARCAHKAVALDFDNLRGCDVLMILESEWP